MNAIAPVSVADRFGLSLDLLCRAVAARFAGGFLSALVIRLIWRRVQRIKGEVRDLLTRFQAGKLRICQGARAAVAAPAGGAGERRSGAGSNLPLRFAWLLTLVPYEAACFAGQVRTILGEPEMAALLEASPQARRVLRPLCRMLGIEAALLLPLVERDAAARAEVPVVKSVTKRVRRPRPKVDWGRIALPRGVLAWAKREGFGKPPRD